MSLIHKNLGLYTDFYELTMAQGYFLSGRHEADACFDYFFRKNPFEGGYTIFAGLEDALGAVEAFTFDEKGLQFLQKEAGLDKRFIEYLKTFRFNGDIHSVREGEVVFPNTPILRVEGNILETQVLETILLNILNFESLIATKASRIVQAASGRTVIDFGLRRAHGWGGIQASRGAAIGGVTSTSNVYSAMINGLQPSGTQAHSWIMSYEQEVEAFRDFAASFPDNCVMLVDTYDTLKSGVPNAIKVAKEMEVKGHSMKGIRLDSGDLAYLSKKSREMLDEAGLPDVKIVASNQLDEYLIKSLLDQQAPIDFFGVGTSMATGQPDAALDGVYKLSYSDGKSRIKLSENIEKVTLPGKKDILRAKDNEGFYADVVHLKDKHMPTRAYHPIHAGKFFDLNGKDSEPLHHQVMRNGKRINQPKKVGEIAAFSASRIQQLPDEYKRFQNPHTYKVSISSELKDERDELVNEIKKRNRK